MFFSDPTWYEIALMGRISRYFIVPMRKIAIAIKPKYQRIFVTKNTIRKLCF